MPVFFYPFDGIPWTTPKHRASLRRPRVLKTVQISRTQTTAISNETCWIPQSLVGDNFKVVYRWFTLLHSIAQNQDTKVSFIRLCISPFCPKPSGGCLSGLPNLCWSVDAADASKIGKPSSLSEKVSGALERSQEIGDQVPSESSRYFFQRRHLF